MHYLLFPVKIERKRALKVLKCPWTLFFFFLLLLSFPSSPLFSSLFLASLGGRRWQRAEWRWASATIGGRGGIRRAGQQPAERRRVKQHPHPSRQATLNNVCAMVSSPPWAPRQGWRHLTPVAINQQDHLHPPPSSSFVPLGSSPPAPRLYRHQLRALRPGLATRRCAEPSRGRRFPPVQPPGCLRPSHRQCTVALASAVTTAFRQSSLPVVFVRLTADAQGGPRLRGRSPPPSHG